MRVTPKNTEKNITKNRGVILEINHNPNYQCLETETILSHAIQAAEIGIWSVDLRSQVVNWSEKLCLMLGISREVFIEQHKGSFTVGKFLDYLHPEDCERVNRIIEQSIIERKKFDSIFRLKHNNGDYLEVHSVGRVIYENNTPIHMTGLVWNANNKHNAEKQLRELGIKDPANELYETLKLSPREKEILLWAADGKTNEETAMILEITERTVRFHLNNIMQKLSVENKTHAVAKAISIGLISPRV